MLATIETEHIMMGDSANLSPNFAARCLLAEEARRCFLAGNNATTVSLRGTAPMMLRLLNDYGTIPLRHHHNTPAMNGNTSARRIAHMAAQSRSLGEVDSKAQRLLDTS